MSLRKKFLWSFLALLIAGMGTSAVLTWRAVERQYLSTQRENLLALAAQSADSYRGQIIPSMSASEYSQVSNAAPGIHSRFLTDQGGVVFNYPPVDDQIVPPAAENSPPVSTAELLARPEIQSALNGTPGSAIRTVSGRRVLYAAAPVLGQTEQISGLVYLAMPIPDGGIPAELALQLGGITLAAVLAMAVIGWFLFKKVLTPIDRLATASEAIGTGSLEQSVSADSGINELDTLALSFNRMTSSLRKSEQSRNAFLADVNHELRTPLTVIQGTIETLQDGALDDLQGRDALLAGMAHETERLIRMVNDLLILNRADNGDLRLNLTPCDLVVLAQERMDFFAAPALKKSIRIRLEHPEAISASTWMDRDRISQVLDNLLANAIQYSPVDSEITIAILRDDQRLVCEVIDNGPGIPVDAIDRVFDRFYRVDPSRGRHSGGAGLGLAISRALIQAHGGEISCTSIPGQRTSFQFWIPTERLPSD